MLELTQEKLSSNVCTQCWQLSANDEPNYALPSSLFAIDLETEQVNLGPQSKHVNSLYSYAQYAYTILLVSCSCLHARGSFRGRDIAFTTLPRRQCIARNLQVLDPELLHLAKAMSLPISHALHYCSANIVSVIL